MSTWMESITQLLASLLTDKETEHVINRLSNLQHNLKKKSYFNLKYKCHHEMNCHAHAIRGLSRTFTISFLVKHAIYVLPQLRKNIFNVFKIKWDTVQFAMFLSSYVSLYRLSMCNITHYTSVKSRAYLSGCIAGLSILLDTNPQRRNGITWLVCARSLYAAAKLFLFRAQLKKEPQTFEIFDSPPNSPVPMYRTIKDKISQFCSNYGSTVFMAVSCSTILFNLTFDPYKVPKAFRSWIFYIGGVQERYQEDGVVMMELLKNNVCAKNLENCQVIHPGLQCGSFYPLFFIQVFFRCMKIYAPLSVASAVIFKHNLLRKHFKHALKLSMKSAVRSSVFLSLLSCTLYGVACFLRRFRGKEAFWHYMINGFLGGLWVILEPTGRRTELALYMLPRTLEALFPNINKISSLLLFVLSSGTLMHVYEIDHRLMGPTQSKVMTRIFGVS
eukprot:NODE_290_length_11632_cov_0.441256.p3 type:complete len:444 gc:universal NODE_290_length_11632_cov_0.441256:2580-1249(-)